MPDNLLPILLIVGLGGVIVWYVLQPVPAQPKPCGIPVSAYGAGTVIPCGAIKEVAAAGKAVIKAPYTVGKSIGGAILGTNPKVSLFQQATGQTAAGLQVSFPPKV